MPALDGLNLSVCKLEQSVFDELSELQRFRDLVLHNCPVETAQLEDLGRLQQLNKLVVANFHLSDPDATHFQGLKKLTNLNVQKNNFTPDGIDTLRKLLPDCRIESDHGTFEPRSKLAASQN